MNRVICLSVILGIFGTLFAASAAEGAGVYFSDVRIAMEPREGAVLVKEMFVLKPPSGIGDAPNTQGIVIAVPRDAEGVDLAEDISDEGVSVVEGGVMLEGPISKTGRRFGVLFLLPVKNGKMLLEQHLGLEVKLAHAALVGQAAEADLSGDGFGQSDAGETPSGLPARFIAGKDFKDGRIQIAVIGLSRDFVYPLTLGFAIISFLVLAAGFGFWIKGRVSKDAEFG